MQTPGLFDAPTDECDLIMKGGITSGIVYPAAVLRLARRYRFRSIGGASAGAIAAAVTAAAEYGRESGGFEKLVALNQQLCNTEFLKNLFSPPAATKPLMDTLFELYRLKRQPQPQGAGATGWRRWLGTAQRIQAIQRRSDRAAFAGGTQAGRARGALVGALTAVALALPFLGTFALGSLLLGASVSAAVALFVLGAAALAGALVGGWVGGVIGGSAASVAGLLRIVAHEIPRNFIGISSGRAENPAAAPPTALTDWLHASINHLAGRHPEDPPLTIGDLETSDKKIELKVVTTNLSHNQPYELPLGRPYRHKLAFKISEFDRLFPPSVMKHLVATCDRGQRRRLPDGYRYFPEAKDLPVVVAARMSLSFPILISAVPLYTVAYKRVARDAKEAIELEEKDLQVNWFSDGGICSNFPIHFFDSWLPSRPTFGIRLAGLPNDAFRQGDNIDPKYLSASADPKEEPSELDDAAGADDPGSISRAVYLPRADDVLAPEWIPIMDPSAVASAGNQAGEGFAVLGRFVANVVSTMQEYRDNTLAMLPSYRERVVVVRLAEHEGGLNLEMPQAVIDGLRQRGEQVGETLEGFQFQHHQWVRFQVLMGQLEAELQTVRARVQDAAFHFQQLRDAQENRTAGFPYRRSRLWCERAGARLDRLCAMMESWGPPPYFQDRAPQPEPTLRVTPRL
jgi:predicted acylesterase/phospholipase RssA